MIEPYFRRRPFAVKRIAAVAAVVVLGILALLQLGSEALFADAAAAGAVPRALPRSAGIAIFAAAARLPHPLFFRRVASQAAIADGRLAQAQDLIASLPPGPDRDDLQGQLFAARGDHAHAVASYVAAGDLVRVGDAVDALDRAGNGAAALQTQRRLVAALVAQNDVDSLAHAYWRLAQLESERGLDRASLSNYQAAIALEPLSETYLLGAANQSMGHGALPLARRYFARVVELDPGSADGRIGLARVALRTGDLTEAGRQAAIVRGFAPAYRDLAQLEHEIESLRAKR
jgi:tetratricopeptide (TPR) repeat protein